VKLILFNTCGAEASVALADTALHKPVVAQSTMPGRTASESLVAEVRKTMVEARWGLSDLDGIVVVTGPGSFTGVRVGLSAAKGLGEAIGKPMIAVSRLAMLAAAAGPGVGRVCALLDAGRGEFYCGQFGEGIEARETLVSKEDALEAALLSEKVVVCEQGVFDALNGSIPLMLVAEPGAADALPFAMKKIAAGVFDDPVKLDASYLRRTDAEIFAKRAG
jgi:tRNA threonylcarbamoyladenosine biosynthesis protein TsaB